MSESEGDFYARLWGNSTAYRSVWYGEKGKAPVLNNWFISTEEALLFIAALDKNKYNIYHACGLFRTKSRKQADFDCACAVWMDLDLKGTTFATKRELLGQLKLLTGTAFETMPWVVDTGNGFHVYWIFDSFLSSEEWEFISNKLYDVAKEKGLQVDHTRTRDAASILRVPNTFNLKDSPKETKLLFKGCVLQKAAFLEDQPKKIKFDKADFNLNNIAQQIEFLKSDINKVADKCAFAKAFKETGLANNEPAWRLALTITLLCVDGVEYAHQFSAQDPTYSARETDYKIQDITNKKIGPALCETVDRFGYCKDCPYKSKIKTPIQLGVIATPIKNKIDDLTDKKEKDRAEELIALAPTTDWIVGQEGIYKYVDGIPVLVCIVPFYIIDLLCEDFNDTTLVTAVIRTYRNGVAEMFKLPLKYVAEDRKLLAEFNGRRIFPANKKLLKEYIASYIMRMNHIKPQRSIVSLGWQPNESFVYNVSGDSYTEKCEEVNCVLDRKMVGYAVGYEARGKLEQWVDGINLLTTEIFRPHLFSLLCSFGAPLLPYTSAKGFLLSLQGSSGSGKTLAHKFAMSVWGNPETAGCLGTYDTHKAILGRLAVAKNLPLRLDEATLLKPQQLTGLIYEIVNGRGRSRATIDGSMANTASEWQTMTFLTTNRPILENDMNVISEAERCRVLELAVNMPENITDIGRKLGAIMEKNYGLAGKEFIKHLIQNKARALELLDEYQTHLQQFADDDKRFWVTCGAIALVAAKCLIEMGLFNFDFDVLQKWFIKTLTDQRGLNEQHIIAARGFKTREELVHALYDSLNGCLLVMNSNFIEVERPNREIKGRIVHITDKECFMYVTTPIVRDFIKKHFVDSYEKVLTDFGIEQAKVKRFAIATARCHEFKL